MQTLLFLGFLAVVFASLLGMAQVCRKPWYPKGFAVTFAAMCTLVIGSIGAFGMWSRANSVDMGEAGPTDYGP